MGKSGAAQVDVVITWVDDRAPGYREVLKAHARSVPDLDPARTRDTLETLRYGLRSLQCHAPWVNRVFLFTCRPQVPSWLETTHPRLTVVHHDQVIPGHLLPTFNSFAIISHLHLIPELSERFLYLEDDMLFLRDVSLTDFTAEDGRPLVFETARPTPRHDTIRNPRSERPWNLALAEANRLLDESFGASARGYVNHVPLLIEKTQWKAMMERFATAFETTRRSRFRAAGNVAPEYLYPHLMLAQGKAVRAGAELRHDSCGYVPLENVWPVTAFALWKLRRQQPKWVTFNDNFGTQPSRLAERLARDFLLQSCPQPSAFERA